MRPLRVVAPFAAIGLAAGFALAGISGESGPPADTSGPPNYSKDIAPIFRRACEKCHRPGQAGPMTLQSFAEIRPWAKAIRASVAGRSMPPFDADVPRGIFENDIRLTEEEIAVIAEWAAAGAPEGDPADLPPPARFAADWEIGAPDLVLKIRREIQVPASGPDKFIQLELQTGLTEDRWISAIEVRPEAPAAVHHVMVYAEQEDPNHPEWADFMGRHGQLLIEHAAGNGGDVFPPGMGRLLKAGAKLLVQIHYHPNGAEAIDRTSIGFRFHPPGFKPRRAVAKPVLNYDLVIPAGTPALEHRAEQLIPREIELLAFQPHMHMRGRAMRLEAIPPGGGPPVLLCDVPRYRHQWQITYTWRQPPRLPAGTRLVVTGVFNNSASNPENPDPSAEVRWGPRAVDEMCIGWIDFAESEAP